MSQEKGFTLLEMIAAIIIVSILATLAVAYYAGYTQRATVTEATRMVGAIVSAQKIYRQNHPSSGFPTCTDADSIRTTLGIDLTDRKYFAYSTGPDGGQGFVVRATSLNAFGSAGGWIQYNFDPTRTLPTWQCDQTIITLDMLPE